MSITGNPDYEEQDTMSVDFFECDRCGETICDCGSWWACEECGVRLCDDCEQEHVDHDDDDVAICPYCSRDLATDTDLLGFALELLGISAEELLARYQAAGEGSEDGEECAVLTGTP